MKLIDLTITGGAVLVAVLALAATATPAAAQAMTCPVPHADSGPGVLKESPTQMAKTGGYLAGSADPNRVPEVVADLRNRYPSVSDTELENYLVAAYCPAVTKLKGLGLAEQRSRVESFSRQVESVIHKN